MNRRLYLVWRLAAMSSLFLCAGMSEIHAQGTPSREYVRLGDRVIAVEVPSAGTPALTITKTPVGVFTQGLTGTYTITVTNSGTAATSGTVNVVDTPPSGLTLASMSGTGWICPSSCSRSDALAASASYPPITVTVNVLSSAPASVTNQATVSGGGSGNNTAQATTVIYAPLTIAKAPTGNFIQGQTATYALTVTNSGTVPSTGTVTVSDAPQSGMTLVSMSGTGWSCSTSCTRSDSLGASSSYPAITVTVQIPSSATSVTNGATVSGVFGMNTASVTTPVSSPPIPSIQSISPSSGRGASQQFTAVFNDPGSDINQAMILFNSSLSGSNACWIYWNGSYFQLLSNDQGTWLGPVYAQSGGSVSNSQCTLTGSNSYATDSGGTLTVYAGITFNTSTFGGTQGAYLYAANPFGNSGWIQEGSWTVPGTSISVSPPGLNDLWANNSLQFTATVTGTNNTAVTWSYNQLGTLSSTGYYTAPSSIAYGQWVFITATSQADSTVYATGYVYLEPPIAVTLVSPSVGSGDRQTFSFESEDGSGGSTFSWIQPMLSTTDPLNNGAMGCHAIYYPAFNALYLDGDNGGNNWVGSTSLGGGDITNDYCIVHGATSSQQVNGNFYTLLLDIQFETPAQGTTKYEFLSAEDNQNNFATWVYFGYWNP